MKFFPRLWQRIFAYAFLMVVVSNLVSMMIFRVWMEREQVSRFLTEVTGNLTEALEGRDDASIGVLFEVFGHHPRKIWLEKADGTILGDRAAELIPASTLRTPLRPGSVAIVETGIEGSRYMSQSPVMLESGPAILSFVPGPGPRPPMQPMLVQGLIAVCTIGGMLSLWIGWRISRPLRQLRREVLDIASSNLEKRVAVQGDAEIAEVSAAVNNLAHNLSQHITSMRELLANLSHEMRSPLARISISAVIVEDDLLTSALKAGPASAPPAASSAPEGLAEPLALKHIHNVQKEIEHMENLIRSSLLTSKLDLQQQKIVLEPVPVSELCEKMAIRHEQLMLSRGLVFERQLAAGLWVSGDAELLGLMLSNLLDNAAKYTEAGGFVRFGLTCRNNLVELRLENRHQPLPEAVLRQIFEPFYRGGQATGDGVGLGLALVDKIVTAHRGTVRAENTDRGVCLSVTLPELTPPAVQ